MSNISKSKFKASRRLGVSLWGDGKDAFNKKNYRPGQHGQKSVMGKTSDYGLHLKAKQRLRMHYGRISEKQFSNTFYKALKMKGNTGETFVGMLESRLDAVVYRMNIASTIFMARQIVSHGHIRVNGNKVNIPSYQLKEGDSVEIKENSKQIALFLAAANKKARTVPGYLSFELSSMSGKFARKPMIADVPYPFEPEVNLVVELYSR